MPSSVAPAVQNEPRHDIPPSSSAAANHYNHEQPTLRPRRRSIDSASTMSDRSNAAGSEAEVVPSRTFQHIDAPTRPLISPGNKTIFLSGSTLTARNNWQAELAADLSHLPVTIFNPQRPDWDSSWVEDIQDLRFRNQVEWELDYMDEADLVFVYFTSKGLSTVTMFEFGLCVGKLQQQQQEQQQVNGDGIESARGRRNRMMLVCCEEGYARRGNVQIVCARHGIRLLDTMEGVVKEIKNILDL